ncbi:hypothetical protein ACFYWX_43140 [Streptomyces sp. NPDC002888]|uniref:hypothetical protein n=1 Tax=Streptomyces sp. NPDC002888 TaxID=3364668 RepID=UPI0036BFE337
MGEESDVAVRLSSFRLVFLEGAGMANQIAGDLTLDWDALSCADDPVRQLVVWTAEPGTPSHNAPPLLTSWVATTDRPAPPHLLGRDHRPLRSRPVGRDHPGFSGGVDNGQLQTLSITPAGPLGRKDSGGRSRAARSSGLHVETDQFTVVKLIGFSL